MRLAPNIWGTTCDKTGRNALSAVVVLSPDEKDRSGMDLVEYACDKGIPTIVVTAYGTRELAKKAIILVSANLFSHYMQWFPKDEATAYSRLRSTK